MLIWKFDIKVLHFKIDYAIIDSVGGVSDGFFLQTFMETLD